MKQDVFKLTETVYKPLIARELLNYKQAELNPFTLAIQHGRREGHALSRGQQLRAQMLGVGGGALAGVPLGVLAQAMFGEEKNLRAYLRSALIGGLSGASIGGGVGGLTHAFVPSLTSTEFERDFMDGKSVD
jgi:hypothetical protein